MNKSKLIPKSVQLSLLRALKKFFLFCLIGIVGLEILISVFAYKAFSTAKAKLNIAYESKKSVNISHKVKVAFVPKKNHLESLLPMPMRIALGTIDGKDSYIMYTIKDLERTSIEFNDSPIEIEVYPTNEEGAYFLSDQKQYLEDINSITQIDFAILSLKTTLTSITTLYNLSSDNNDVRKPTSTDDQ